MCSPEQGFYQSEVVQPNVVMTREDWLFKLSQLMNQHMFDDKMPKYRVTCGFPSKMAFSKVNRRIGEHWPESASSDQTHEIVISMTVDDDMEVAGVLAHEMIHAVCEPGVGHRGPFRDNALRIGLTGKMTATTEGPKFIESVKPWLESLGKYPHAKMVYDPLVKKQTTRLIKCECLICGYNVRVTRKWLDEEGMPCCPNITHGPMSSEYQVDTAPEPRLGVWNEITPQEPVNQMSVFACRKGDKDSLEYIKVWVHSLYGDEFTHFMPSPDVVGLS